MSIGKSKTCAEEDDERADISNPTAFDICYCCPQRWRQTLEDHVRSDRQVDERNGYVQVNGDRWQSRKVYVAREAGKCGGRGDNADDEPCLAFGEDGVWCLELRFGLACCLVVLVLHRKHLAIEDRFGGHWTVNSHLRDPIFAFGLEVFIPFEF